MITGEKMYRVIFEFEATDQVETFLDLLGVNLDSGTLKITGKWSWGAETIEPIYYEGEDEDEG